MKTRSGFVSNSSSSSFIIGIGKITNQQKFDTYIKENDITVTDKNSYGNMLEVYSLAELKKMEGWCKPANVNKTTIEVEAPINECPSVWINSIDIKEDDKIVILCVGNDEGDDSFSVYNENDEWDYLNYDIELDWFCNEQVFLYQAFCEEAGIENSMTLFGAGRNG